MDNRCCKFFFEGEKDFDELTIDELNMWLLSKEMSAEDCDRIRGELTKICEHACSIRPHFSSHPGHYQISMWWAVISSIDKIGKSMVCISIDIMEKQLIIFQRQKIH